MIGRSLFQLQRVFPLFLCIGSCFPRGRFFLPLRDVTPSPPVCVLRKPPPLDLLCLFPFSRRRCSGDDSDLSLFFFFFFFSLFLTWVFPPRHQDGTFARNLHPSDSPLCFYITPPLRVLPPQLTTPSPTFPSADSFSSLFSLDELVKPPPTRNSLFWSYFLALPARSPPHKNPLPCT